MPHFSQKNNRKIKQQSWKDFKGSNRVKIDDSPYNTEVQLPLEIKATADIDWDKLAKQHGAAFKRGEITRERLASILELRSIIAICPTMTIHSLAKLDQNLIPHFLHNQGDKNDWQPILEKISPEERFYTEVNIDIDTLNDSRLFNLVIFAHRLGVIYIKDFEDINSYRFIYNSGIKKLSFYIPSVNARDEFTKHIYGESAKPLLAGVGVFTLDDIERSVRNKMRYGVFSYPGVKDTTVFHEIHAPIFYMSLHDELHRRLMSSIPNKTLEAYLKAIDTVRAKTGIYWSTDIWNGIDLEIGAFDQIQKNVRESNDPQVITQHFERLLSAKKYSNKEELGLFSNKEYSLDTLFILLVDLVENKSKWQELGIEKDYFSSRYQQLINFVEANFEKIKMLPSARQVAFLKRNWINHDSHQSVSDKLPTHCRFKKIDDYVQVTTGGKIIGNKSKAKSIALNYYYKKSKLLDEAINFQREIVLQDENISKLNKKAIEVRVKLDNLIIDHGDTYSLKKIKNLTDIVEVTAYLLTDPNNKYLQRRYSDLICSQISLPQKIKASLKGFLETVVTIARESEARKAKRELLANNIRFFKEIYATPHNQTELEFRNAALRAPVSFKKTG